MKVSVDDREIFTLTETQKLVIQNDIESEIFDEDMKRRLKWVLLDEKYARCFTRLKSEWDEKLSINGVESIPLDKDAYASLVFSQPNYKSKSARVAEEKKAAEEAQLERNS